MRDRNTCNYCIYCIYFAPEYHCRYKGEDYMVEKNNPKCEDYVEAEKTAIQNKPFSIPRRMKW